MESNAEEAMMMLFILIMKDGFGIVCNECVGYLEERSVSVVCEKRMWESRYDRQEEQKTTKRKSDLDNYRGKE